MLEFISTIHLSPRNYRFQIFQDLPDLIRSALVWGTESQDAGLKCGVREVTHHIIRFYDNRQSLTIGELIERLNEFIDCPVCCRMVRCYVDHGCDMVAAKLAWREDY